MDAYNDRMFDIDTKELKRLESELKVFKERAFPFATKALLNTSAFAAQREARKNLRDDFTLRNKFVERSVRVTQTRTLVIRNQMSIVGSDFDGIERQELGGSIRKKGKEGIPIPTGIATGEGEGARPRKRLPRGANRLRAIQLRDTRNPGKTRQQRNLIAIRQATERSAKDRFIFLNLGRRKGIFKVIGGKRSTRIKMIFSFEETAVTIRRKPWLLPAVNKIQKRMPEFYLEALRFQVKRHRLFK